MKQFSEINIKPKERALVGDKIDIDNVLNKRIVVTKFHIKESRFKDKGNGRCLHLQIKFNQEDRVIFTGSGGLMHQVEQMTSADFPFEGTIVKENKEFKFT